VNVNEEALNDYLEVVFGFLDDGYIPLRGFAESTDNSQSSNHTLWVENTPQGYQHALTFAGYCNNNQQACYCIPGLVNEKGHAKADEVIQMGVLLVDLDHGDINAKLAHAAKYVGTPSMVVESGGKTDLGQPKLHLYWKLSEAADHEDITRLVALRHLLAQKIGADTHFQSAHQPIRIAGSIHHKTEASAVHIKQHNKLEYHLCDLDEAIEEMPSLDGITVPDTTDFCNFNEVEAHISIGELLDMKVRSGGQDDVTRFESMCRVIGHFVRQAFKYEISEQQCWQSIVRHNENNLIPSWSIDRLRQTTEGIKRKHIEHNPVAPNFLSMQPPSANMVVNDSMQWPDPEPLHSHSEQKVSGYPLHCLPNILQEAAKEVARFVKVDAASPAVIGLSVAALAIGKSAKIEERPGLFHHPALFHTLIAASGERKSPPFKLMTKPLEEWIQRQLGDYQHRIAEINNKNEVLDSMLVGLKKQASNAKCSEQERQYLIQKMADEECTKQELPPHPRMFTSDSTEERLFQRMHERGGDYSVLSGEGRPIFDSIMGKYSGASRTGDAIYLAGISGDTITRDRVGNDSGPEDRMIIDPCLNVCVMVQPDKYMEAARHPTLRESGALARIWPVWLPSLVGSRIEEKGEKGLDAEQLQPYESWVKKFLDAKNNDGEGSESCHIVSLSPEAQELRRQWHNSVEVQMAEGCSFNDVKDIASKAISATVKAALVLHLVKYPEHINSESSVLSVETWKQAQALGQYHLDEAIRVQRNVGEVCDDSAMVKIIHWAQTSNKPEFSIRELSQSGPRPRMNQQDAKVVLDEMIEMSWLRMLPPLPGKRVNRYQVNPKCSQM
jgi:hypothetical protein